MTANPNDAVYKTLVEPHPDSIPNLTGWKRPTHAYVLIEMPQWNLTASGKTLGKGLYTLNAESRAEVMHLVDAALNEGGRILDYGNFPKFNDVNNRRAEKAMHYSQGGMNNPWDTLEKHVRMKMNPDITWNAEKAAMQAEVDALKAKLAEQNAKKATPAKEEKRDGGLYTTK